MEFPLRVVTQGPRNSGSRYYNYKGTFALVDAGYRLLIIDVGSFGRNSDGGTFAFSALWEGIEAK